MFTNFLPTNVKKYEMFIKTLPKIIKIYKMFTNTLPKSIFWGKSFFPFISKMNLFYGGTLLERTPFGITPAGAFISEK